MCLSKFLDISSALLISLRLSPRFSLSISKNSCVFLPLGRRYAKNLSIASLFDSSSFLLLIKDFIDEPSPPTAPINNDESKPNFILFATSLAALSSSFGLSCVGPPNISPIVPTCSGSPTNIISDTPAAPAPPSVANNLPFALSDVLNLS